MSKTADLQPYFSEYALIKYRVKMEITYFLAMHEAGIPQINILSQEDLHAIRSIQESFTIQDAQRIKEIEKKTNHDVKAVEYFICEKLTSLQLDKYIPWIHFGLTSQDINNTAFPLMFRSAMDAVMLPNIRVLLQTLEEMAGRWKNVAMLARTHGQPASPTTMGKELHVFSDRLQKQLSLLEKLPHEAKFGGATGNFNAHYVAFPDIDWPAFADKLLGRLGLERQQWTTQIDQYDSLSAHLQNISRLNTILTDLCRDIWQYIAMEYLVQVPVKDEVGSSTMPHKVNPIDFENAEGNLGMANAMLNHLAGKLPVSRLQRDLTDSTVLRNLGVPLAHSLIAYKSILKGLGKIDLNEKALYSDLEDYWVILAEPIQTMLRREAVPDAYELLKAFTRGKAHLDRDAVQDFIRGLPLRDTAKKALLDLTPHNYIGNAGNPNS